MRIAGLTDVGDRCFDELAHWAGSVACARVTVLVIVRAVECGAEVAVG